MSDTFNRIRSILLLACLFVLGHSTPIKEESTLHSYGEKEGIHLSTTERELVSGSGPSPAKKYEGHHIDILSSDAANVLTKADVDISTAVPLTLNGVSEMGGRNNEKGKRDADDDDSDYDDSRNKDESEERGRALLRSFLGMHDRVKRAYSRGEAEEESATKNESDFVDHVLDYSLDRKKREIETTTAVEVGTRVVSGRKRRQSGETVPYITPNRSRRDGKEARESGGRLEAEREQEEEEEEEEIKGEDTDEKLAMES